MFSLLFSSPKKFFALPYSGSCRLVVLPLLAWTTTFLQIPRRAVFLKKRSTPGCLCRQDINLNQSD
jgi:hypothetical protein